MTKRVLKCVVGMLILGQLLCFNIFELEDKKNESSSYKDIFKKPGYPDVVLSESGLYLEEVAKYVMSIWGRQGT